MWFWAYHWSIIGLLTNLPLYEMGWLRRFSSWKKLVPCGINFLSRGIEYYIFSPCCQWLKSSEKELIWICGSIFFKKINLSQIYSIVYSFGRFKLLIPSLLFGPCIIWNPSTSSSKGQLDIVGPQLVYLLHEHHAWINKIWKQLKPGPTENTL